MVSALDRHTSHGWNRLPWLGCCAPGTCKHVTSGSNAATKTPQPRRNSIKGLMQTRAIFGYMTRTLGRINHTLCCPDSRPFHPVHNWLAHDTAMNNCSLMLRAHQRRDLWRSRCISPCDSYTLISFHHPCRPGRAGQCERSAMSEEPSKKRKLDKEHIAH